MINGLNIKERELLVTFLYHSEVFSIKKHVTSSENNIPCIAKLILLSYIAHIEELLAVKHEKCSASVQISGNKDRNEGPDNKLLDHCHSEDAAHVSKGKCVTQSSHIDIISVFSPCNIGPIFLYAGFVI